MGGYDPNKIEWMRKKIAEVFDGVGWKWKCYNKFGPDQVYAIYMSFKERGRFDKRKKEVADRGWEQLTIFDYGLGVKGD